MAIVVQGADHRFGGHGGGLAFFPDFFALGTDADRTHDQVGVTVAAGLGDIQGARGFSALAGALAIPFAVVGMGHELLQHRAQGTALAHVEAEPGLTEGVDPGGALERGPDPEGPNLRRQLEAPRIELHALQAKGVGDKGGRLLIAGQGLSAAAVQHRQLQVVGAVIGAGVARVRNLLGQQADALVGKGRPVLAQGKARDFGIAWRRQALGGGGCGTGQQGQAAQKRGQGRATDHSRLLVTGG